MVYCAKINWGKKTETKKGVWLSYLTLTLLMSYRQVEVPHWLRISDEPSSEVQSISPCLHLVGLRICFIQ